MPNWCYTNYVATGDKEEVADLGKKMKDMMSMQKSLLKNDFGAGWLGNLVHIFGGDPKAIGCRGDIVNVIEETECLYFETETAWTDANETFNFIESRYKTLKFFFFASETGVAGYWTNDKDGIHFPERYIVDQVGTCPEGYVNLEEFLKEVSSKVGKCVNSFEEARVSVDEFNEQEEHEYDQIFIYQVDIVDRDRCIIKKQIN
jgi:hypothetical protein